MISASGLSPRIRGTGRRWCPLQLRLWFIPAYTGNGHPKYKKSIFAAVYPRVYGERAQLALEVGAGSGLSPRIRGTAAAFDSGVRDQRFIPAYTGNGLMFTQPRLATSVYPRVYGERPPPLPSMQATTGLSPRIRGTADRLVVGIDPDRFIPAYTGNGFRRCLVRWGGAVYPRVYGERASKCRTSSTVTGLSPRIRGTVLQVLLDDLSQRFIPAYTGNGAA